MKKLVLSIAVFAAANIIFAQSITNINPAQRTDGSKIVDVYYDLAGPEPAYSITMEVSLDGGTSFTAATNITGDTGAVIAPGAGKHIIWDFGTQYPNQFTNQAQIRITASEVLLWSCGDSLLDIRDNQTYPTVLIGTQCWMAANLNIGTMIQGTDNPANNGVIEKYCYDNSAPNCSLYGGMYQWDEMMGYATTQGVQGICPEGWYIPTDEEWKELEGEADSQYNYPDPVWDNSGWRGFDVGKNLKSTSGWNSGGNGTDLYGFTGLPGGFRYSNGVFYDAGNGNHWWFSSENLGAHAWGPSLYNYSDGSFRSFYDQSYGFSVRCLKEN